MSKYRAQTTRFKDRDCLIGALKAAGYDESVIEVHEDPKQLYDYCNRPTTYTDPKGDKANIIIRRNNIGYGAANDLGFLFDKATGTYKAMVSAFDSGAHHWGANSPRMMATEQEYAMLATRKSLKKQGFKYLKTTMVNGKKQDQFLYLKS
jgi:hypothetical protein